LIISGTTKAATTYTIEASHNDEIFIIDGEKFEAKYYCLNFEEDDEVIFIDGHPYACVEAKILNLRTRNVCEVWCE
jgi:hypothetical protein